MRVPLSWIREYVDLPRAVSATEVAARLTMLGLKLESVEAAGADVSGPLVVGRVLDFEIEHHSNGKTVRWCQVDVGQDEPRGIVCGAANFAVGDLVVVSLPGAVLAGGFAIAARKTYGHVSDGMICSARELGLGDEHGGIVVLGADEAKPGDDAAGVLQLCEDVIDLEITPDRSYALSVRGVAREVATAYGLPFADPARLTEPVKSGDGYPVIVDDPSGCDVFVALEVTGFNAQAASPRWLARRVQLAGMRPISLAVDVTNYVMLELGQPNHGYDKAALQGPIVVRRTAAGETLTTLDGVTRSLGAEDLLITDDRGPIGLAGLMGGEATEMGPSTTDIVIEAGHFDPVTVARAARRHKLPSEASKRFERGVDPTVPGIAARRVAELLVAFGGGTIASTATVVGGAGVPTPLTISTQLPTQVAGFPIDDDTALLALRTVGCQATSTAGRITATPPPWRMDITDPYDLVEEVMRIVGYDKVPSVLPVAPAGRGMSKQQRLRRRVGIVLASVGYVEALSYPFTGPRDMAALGLGIDDSRRAAVRIANPLSDEEPLLRTTVLPGLLHALARNVARGQPDVGLFEIGAVFHPVSGDHPVAPALGVDRAPTVEQLKELAATLPDQPLHLGLVASGLRQRGGWWGKGQPSCWADAIEACRLVAGAVGVDVHVIGARRAPWHPGRCARILIGDTTVGHAGELHPKVCDDFGVPARAAAAELDLDALLAHAVDVVAAPQFSSYPVGKEDVALIVDAAVPAADVEASLQEGAGELLESVRLFDVYVGEQIGPEKKSLAYALRFRAPDRTLTETEIKAARDAAVAAATMHVGATQRT
ncbi:MAG: phenylalanine--tRNA ligase subunit beta [Nocardioidaceae bacterium]